MDAIVTDPPYELGFNGEKWDSTGVALRPETWAGALRVLKPGSYLLAFGGTRTYHRMTTAIEDAGFQIQDCIAWMYANGFPKHRSKFKPAWEPIVVARKPAPRPTLLNIDGCRDNGRWPANVILDQGAAFQLDAEVDGVNPSRFFYVPKATPDEKDAGLAGRGFTPRARGLMSGLKETPTRPRFNPHPTVKPIALMRRLIRLVKAPIAASPASSFLVWDPFMGSGTTGCAAELEQVQFGGSDLDRENVRIARSRIRHWREVAQRGH